MGAFFSGQPILGQILKSEHYEKERLFKRAALLASRGQTEEQIKLGGLFLEKGRLASALSWYLRAFDRSQEMGSPCAVAGFLAGRVFLQFAQERGSLRAGSLLGFVDRGASSPQIERPLARKLVIQKIKTMAFLAPMLEEGRAQAITLDDLRGLPDSVISAASSARHPVAQFIWGERLLAGRDRSGLVHWWQACDRGFPYAGLVAAGRLFKEAAVLGIIPAREAYSKVSRCVQDGPSGLHSLPSGPVLGRQ